jgi:DNA replication initiation complex subunit (GINS family)
MEEGQAGLGFNALREIQRKEREYTPLQPLPADFYLQVALYFSTTNKTIHDLSAQRDSNEFAAKVLHQRETEALNAREVVKDVFARRLRKILVLAHEAVFTNAIVDTNLFTSEEKEIFDSLSKRLSEFNARISARLLSSAISSGKSGFLMVEFNEAVPAFVGADMRSYGPFEPGAKAELPEKNAELFIQRGSARKI